MYKKIEISASTTPAELSALFAKYWDEAKVVHVAGREFSSGDEMRAFYDEFMESAGVPGEVGEDATAAGREGQRTGQRWTEIRYDPMIPDAYRHSANPQPLHTDGSYVPDFPDTAIIYCQAAANNGGETVFLDSRDLLSAAEAEAPELLKALREDVLPHRRSGTERVSRVMEGEGDDVQLFWNYYCVADDIDQQQSELREKFHTWLNSSERVKAALVEVALKPGESVMWKDYRVLHGRNGFDPKRPSERFLWKGAFAAAS
jgi:alpha-ketoglutarate-dependent taurine dioxygenase